MLLSRSPMMMMITNGSRRSWLMALIGGVAFLFGILLVKDLNDKLAVTAASNAEYQKMTDKQLDSIKKLQSELRDEQNQHEDNQLECRNKEKEMKSKSLKDLEAAEGKFRMEMEEMNLHKHRMEKKLDEMKSQQKEINARLNAAESELQKMVTKLQESEENRNRLQQQYVTLFKQHQISENTIQYLNAEKDRLQIQLENEQKSFHLKPQQQSSQSPQKQIMQPAAGKGQINKKIRSGSIIASSTAKSSNSRNVNIAEPFHPQQQGNQGRISTKSSPIKVAPVAAEPPINRGRQIIHHQDVMEAPSFNVDYANPIHHGHYFDNHHHQYIDQNNKQSIFPDSNFGQQHKNNFVQPDSVRFQRREVLKNHHPNNVNQDNDFNHFGETASADGGEGGEEGNEDEDDEEEEDHIHVYGQAPMLLRHIDHELDENQGEVFDQRYGLNPEEFLQHQDFEFNRDRNQFAGSYNGLKNNVYNAQQQKPIISAF